MYDFNPPPYYFDTRILVGYVKSLRVTIYLYAQSI